MGRLPHRERESHRSVGGEKLRLSISAALRENERSMLQPRAIPVSMPAPIYLTIHVAPNWYCPVLGELRCLLLPNRPMMPLSRL